VNVGKAERWMSVLAGGALAGVALRSRSPAAAAAAIAAAALVWRGATGHCDVYQAAGMNTARGRTRNGRGPRTRADFDSDTRARLGGQRGIVVEESVTIRRDIDDVYRFWRQLDNLPRFLTHLESVNFRPDGTSHWVAHGPAGMRMEWDARIINEVENDVIGWQSLEGSQVATAGSVHFSESKLGTTLRVHFQYDPPGGRFGAAVAALFGEDPARAVRDDLRRLKRILENEDSVRVPRYSPVPPPV